MIYRKIIEDQAAIHGLDPDLVEAIIQVESSGRTFAVRYEPHTTKYVLDDAGFSRLLKITRATEQMCQMTSWGLMQVMGFVARENGFKGILTELCTPSTGIEAGCIHLSKLKKRFSKSDHDFVSAYNQGSPRRDEFGKYKNQDYVDKVLIELKRIRGGR